MSSAGDHLRLRAPSENGGKLFVPAWDELPQLARENRSALDACQTPILDQPLATLAQTARREFLHIAGESGLALERALERPIVLTGHQPELFHPGVWLKNSVSARLARRVEGLAANLTIDSDLCRSATVPVLAGSLGEPRVERVPFDALAAERPYEERTIVDRDAWNSFGQRAERLIAPLVPEPLLATHWPQVVRYSQESPHLTTALTRARSEQEIAWGFGTAEITQSALCQTDSFRRFALHLWLHAPEFLGAYNAALAEYRHTHRLRNAAQPMPDLTIQDDWHESPFWIWNTHEPERRGLFVRREAKRLLLSDRHGFEVSIQGVDSLDDDGPESLHALEERGIKIRTRALATTLFTRSLIADLFVHGIGGAKYDQVTNSLCERFFGVALPHYATVTGTLRLPLDYHRPPLPRESDILHLLREVRFHPETLRHEMDAEEDELAEIERLVEFKNRWVHTNQTFENAAERHRQISRANEQLAERLQRYHQTLEAILASRKQRNRQEKLLFSREYSYCLFPADYLRGFLCR